MARQYVLLREVIHQMQQFSLRHSLFQCTETKTHGSLDQDIFMTGAGKKPVCYQTELFL